MLQFLNIQHQHQHHLTSMNILHTHFMSRLASTRYQTPPNINHHKQDSTLKSQNLPQHPTITPPRKQHQKDTKQKRHRITNNANPDTCSHSPTQTPNLKPYASNHHPTHNPANLKHLPHTSLQLQTRFAA